MIKNDDGTECKESEETNRMQNAIKEAVFIIIIIALFGLTVYHTIKNNQSMITNTFLLIISLLLLRIWSTISNKGAR